MGLLSGIESQRTKRLMDDNGYQDKRLQRALEMNRQPWGAFLLGIVVRLAIVFAIAATVITIVQYLRR